jgi:hypothetical protein
MEGAVMSLADDLIRSGEYRIKIIKRSPPLWDMYIPKVKGLFGYKFLRYDPDIPWVYTGYLTFSYQITLELAKKAILNHYNQNHTTTELYEPTFKD